VVLCSSQKTLPIAVAVLQQLGPALGPAAGLAVVPCIACHIGQILVDSVLVARWNAEGARAGGA
jgi:sodium/bile acid cotransporter 7